MIDLTFSFEEEHIKLGEKKFVYTTKKGKLYSKNKNKLNDIFERIMGYKLERYNFNQLNNIEKEIVSIFVDEPYWLRHTEDFEKTDLYEISLGMNDSHFKQIHLYFTDMFFEIQDLYDKKDHWILFRDLCYRSSKWYSLNQEDYSFFCWDEISPIESEIISFQKIEDVLEILSEEFEIMLPTKEQYQKMIKKEKKNISFLIDKIDSLTYFKNDRIYYEKPKSDTKKTKQTYIIKDDNNPQWYKIGKSIDPFKREKTLQSEKPSIKIVKIFKEDHEKQLHEQYKKNRGRGEWFKLSNLQLKYICTHYD